MRHRLLIVVGSLAAMLSASALTTAASGDSIAWRQSYEAAAAEAAATGRPMLLHFGATWCGPCRNVERTVFTNPEAVNLVNHQFVPVRIDVDAQPHLKQRFGVETIPADLVVAANGSVVERESGARSPAVYVASLQRALRYYAQSVAAAAMPVPTTPAMGVTQAAQQGATIPPRPIPPRPSAQTLAGKPPAVIAGVGYQASARNFATPPQQPPVGSAPVHPAAPTVAPSGNPPLALEGFCPVTLVDGGKWAPGRVEYGLRHRGRTYLFAGPDEWQRFNANPDKYAPLASGFDPVLMVDARQQVDGRRRHGVTYRGHVLLFASEETLSRFSRDPERYAALVRPTAR